MDDYCNFCGIEHGALSKTREGRAICEICKKLNRFCERCGSITDYYGQHPKDQLHFSNECY